MTPCPSPPENGNRYEGYWERGMKNGLGRFFHLDHGQLFEGFWVDSVAKCGTMIDFGRDEAPEPTKFPIPEVGSSHQIPEATPNPERKRKPQPQPHLRPGPAQPGNKQDFVFSQCIPREAGSTPPHHHQIMPHPSESGSNPKSWQHAQGWQLGHSMLPNQPLLFPSRSKF